MKGGVTKRVEARESIREFIEHKRKEERANGGAN